MLKFDKMTLKAQEALQQANEVAALNENQQIEPVHLLAALVSQTDGVVSPLLARLGIRSEELTQEIEREIARLPKVQGFAQQHMGKPLNNVLARAFEEAERFK
ncbi:MAG: Clp protease N-terminal domain-containing protein, partial [Candidatus Acidiferrum sp.]